MFLSLHEAISIGNDNRMSGRLIVRGKRKENLWVLHKEQHPLFSLFLLRMKAKSGFDKKRKDEEMSLTGTWNLSIAAPVGMQYAVIELTEINGGIAGVIMHAGQTLPLINPALHGNRLTWQVFSAKPRVLLTYDVTINGDTLTGTSTPEPHPPANVTGTRASEK